MRNMSAVAFKAVLDLLLRADQATMKLACNAHNAPSATSHMKQSRDAWPAAIHSSLTEKTSPMKTTLIRKTRLTSAVHSLAALVICATASIAGAATAQDEAQAPLRQEQDRTLPAPAAKVEIFKQVMANGQIFYGDAPISGRKVEKVITVPYPQVSTVWSSEYDVKTAANTVRTGLPDENRLGAQVQIHHSEDLPSGIVAAEEDFRIAEKAYQDGKEPLAGERSRNANGTTRLNELYFARQKMLKDNRDASSSRLYDAYEAARSGNR